MGAVRPKEVGKPTIWCAPMHVVATKSGEPRRVVDFQKLNQACLRQAKGQENDGNTKKPADITHAVERDNTSKTREMNAVGDAPQFAGSWETATRPRR